MQPKSPANREQKEREDLERAVYRSWCDACVEGRGVRGQDRIEPLEEEERERTTPIVAFDCGLDTGTRRHVSNSALSRHRVWSNGSDVSCLVGFMKKSGFAQNHFEMRQ